MQLVMQLWVRPSRIKIINHVLQLLTPCAILSRDNMHDQLIHRVGVELHVIDDMEDLRQNKAQAKTVNGSSIVSVIMHIVVPGAVKSLLLCSLVCVLCVQ